MSDTSNIPQTCIGNHLDPHSVDELLLVFGSGAGSRVLHDPLYRSLVGRDDERKARSGGFRIFSGEQDARSLARDPTLNVWTSTSFWPCEVSSFLSGSLPLKHHVHAGFRVRAASSKALSAAPFSEILNLVSLG